VPACQSLDCISVFAATMADADLVRRVAQGLDATDPFSRAMATCGLETDTPVIGVPSPESRAFHGDDEAAALFQDAVNALPGLGWEVVEIDYRPLGAVAQLLYGGPFVAERYAAVGPFCDAHEQEVHSVVGKIIRDAKAWGADELFKGLATLSEARRAMAERWHQLDAILLPTAPIAPTIAAMLDDPVALTAKLGTYTNFVNLLDCAAVSVPAGFRRSSSAAGMPFGVTLVGPAFSDADLAYLGDRLHRTLLPETGGERVPLAADDAIAPEIPDGWIRLAVVGAHLKGQPLNHQLTDVKARFVSATRTSPHYRLFALAVTKPAKPGLIYDCTLNGPGIEVEIWALPSDGFGRFVDAIPGPLGVGKVSLTDGTQVTGFLCEACWLEGARDITAFGGWRAYLAADRA
jgi:allophanate hydrolase